MVQVRYSINMRETISLKLEIFNIFSVFTERATCGFRGESSYTQQLNRTASRLTPLARLRSLSLLNQTMVWQTFGTRENISSESVTNQNSAHRATTRLLFYLLHHWMLIYEHDVYC